MASTTIFFARMLVIGVLVIPLTRVKLMPMETPEVRRFDGPQKEQLQVHGQESFYPAEDDATILTIPSIKKRQSEIEAEDATPVENERERYSEEIVSEENENRDDLETAAGTNVLRPLFVYRQQLAYRARVKKAGRRAAPNF